MAKPVGSGLPRKFADEVRLELSMFDMFEMKGSLYPLKKSGAGKEEKFNYACPECAKTDVASPMESRLICAHEDGRHDGMLFTSGEAMKGQIGPDKVFRLVGTAEEVKAAKASGLEAKVGSILCLNADDTDASTYSGGTAYVFLPEKKTELFNILVDLLDSDGRMREEDGDRVLLMEINLRGNQKLMKLVSWNGQLVLQELIRPEDLAEFPQMADEPDEKKSEMVRKLFLENTEKMDAEKFKSASRERIAEFVAARHAGQDIPLPIATAIASNKEDDMFDLLAKSLEQNKKKSSKKAS